MKEREAKRRFDQASVARLATVTPTNDPHLVPICFAVDPDSCEIVIPGRLNEIAPGGRLDQSVL